MFSDVCRWQDEEIIGEPRTEFTFILYVYVSKRFARSVCCVICKSAVRFFRNRRKRSQIMPTWSCGNPAVMEKVKVDTEIRKLDQLRAAHRNQQHGIRLQSQIMPTWSCGNPAVMEKVKTDTEIRKLDQLRAAHRNQQHGIRLQIRPLPSEIKERQERIERLVSRYRDARRPRREEFSIRVGNRVFSGKGAREEERRRSPWQCCRVVTT